MKQTDLGEKLEQIADRLADDLLTETNLPIPELVSAFKALSNFHAMQHKLNPPNDDEEGSAFHEHQESLANLGTGAGKRPRANGAARPKPA